MPSNLNAVFPCLKKEESEVQKKDRSLIIYIQEEYFFLFFPWNKKRVDSTGSEGKNYMDLYGNPNKKHSKDIYTQKLSIKKP